MSYRDFPEDVQRRARAIMDRAARRMLEERLALADHRDSYRRGMPAWGVYDAAGKLVATIRAPSAEEARGLFHRHGIRLSGRVRRLPRS
jgi:hypothetical protein